MSFLSKLKFIPYLTAIFICLKLLSCISWPWIWVTCPLWIPAVLVLVGAVNVLLTAILTIAVICVLAEAGVIE